VTIARPKRFVTLDGMRGIAALFILVSHVGKVYPVWTPGQAYLAVDLLFALSGFVLARTSDHRFAAGMTARDFMIRRIVRLYPLYFMGCLLGLVECLVTAQASVTAIVIAGLPNFMLLPSISIVDKPRLFVLNGPAWSLFSQLWIANLAYALLWKRIDARSLTIALIVFAVALLLVDRHFRHLDLGSLRATALGGMARVAFSFTAGVALWRLYERRACPARLPSWLLLAVLMLILMPTFGDGRAHIIYDFAVVTLVFPAMIYLGAGAYERRPAVGTFAGDLSYALYITHVPILLLWKFAFPGAEGWTGAAIAGVLALAIVAAMTLDRYYDPLGRRWIGALTRPRTPADGPAAGGSPTKPPARHIRTPAP
jgi:peptidoglycan/LPS O-acetylase OafA/YrhL